MTILNDKIVINCTMELARVVVGLPPPRPGLVAVGGVETRVLMGENVAGLITIGVGEGLVFWGKAFLTAEHLRFTQKETRRSYL